MGKATYPGPPAALARYERIVAAVGDLERKGAKNPYTSLNGHMFSFLDAAGTIAIRLSPADREAWALRYPDDPVIQYGSVMRGYVALPETVCDDLAEATTWLTRSRSWIATLEPKPTKKSN